MATGERDPLHAVLAKLDRIDAGLFGDPGDPGRPGLVGRVASLESDSKTARWWGKLSVGAALTALGITFKHLLGWDR